MNRWINIAILFSLVGCAATPVKVPETEAATNAPESILSGVNHNTVIDEEVLYLLMAAELAGQRNQYDLALDAYLQAAKRVDDPRIAERAVKIGLFLKDERRTQEALGVWLEKDGKNLNARKFALLLAIKNANRLAAIENLQVMLQADPAGFDSGLLELIKLFEKEGRSQFTYEVLDAVLAQPHQPSVLFVQAVLASMMSDNDLAQSKISEVLELQPEWSKAIIFQAQLAGRRGEMDKARRFLEKAVKQNPDDTQLRKMLIEVLVNNEAYDDALKVCLNVLDEKPDDGDSLFAIAMIYLQQNQVDKAENYLEKLLSNPDWDDQASYYLGKIEQQKHRLDKALSWFDKVGEGRFSYDADMSAVSILVNQKRVDDAELRIKRMEAKYPEQHVRILLTKAEVFNQLGKYQEAFEVLTLALKEVPDNRDVLYARALVAEHLDRLDILEADLLAILQKRPDDVSALNAMGYTLADRTTRYQEAEKFLLHALKLQPDEAVVIDSYGWLLFKQGQAEQALEYLKKAFQKQQENEIAAHIIEVQWFLGNKKEAKDLFDSLIKKAPEDTYLQDVKKRVLQSGQ